MNVNKTCILFLLIIIIPPIGLSRLKAETKRIYRDDISVLKDSTVFFNSDKPLVRNTIEVVFSFPGKNEGIFSKQKNLSLIWNYRNMENYYCATFEQDGETMDDMVDSRYMKIRIYRYDSGVISEIDNLKISENIGLGKEENIALLSITGNSVEIGLGHRTPNIIWEGAITNNPDLSIGLKSLGAVNISEIVCENEINTAQELLTGFKEENIKELENNTLRKNPNIGIWSYLDRNMNDSFARTGGRYRLGIIPDKENPGSYLLIYLSGAEVNPASWQEGMIKGKLKSTPFENHYDLIWYDSKMDVIDTDCYADISDEMIITLSFPLMKSSIRLYKED